jgi:fused signal recognition particle receptor
MDSVAVYAGIAVVVLLVIAIGAVSLVRSQRTRRHPGAGTSTQTAPSDIESGGIEGASGEIEGASGEIEGASGEIEELPAEADDTMAVLEVEVPAPAAGRMQRLRARLARSNHALGRGLLTLVSRDRIDDATWDEIEETLLVSDLGVGPTAEVMQRLRLSLREQGAGADPQTVLRQSLLDLVDPSLDRSLTTSAQGRPAVVLVVGVNGTGKTTTTGKLARLLVAEGKAVLLGAADTFRAAAADQLQTWGDRVGAAVVRGPAGADPASVAFEAVSVASQAELDVVVIDTAGRLHTKTGLMDELGKVKRVIDKQAPIDEVLLVLDATTGQNGLVQARVFAEVVDITGIVLTKLDGTAKGGIVVAVQRELGVPVKLVGLGEGPDDLAPFIAEEFVDALLQE